MTTTIDAFIDIKKSHSYLSYIIAWCDGPSMAIGLISIKKNCPVLVSSSVVLLSMASWRLCCPTVSLVSRVLSFFCDGRVVEINTPLESSWSTKLKSITFDPNRAIFD